MRMAILIGPVILVVAIVGGVIYGVQSTTDTYTQTVTTLTQNRKALIQKGPELNSSSSKEKMSVDTTTKDKSTQSSDSQSDDGDSGYQGPTTTVLPSGAVPPGMGIPIGSGLSIVVTP